MDFMIHWWFISCKIINFLFSDFYCLKERVTNWYCLWLCNHNHLLLPHSFHLYLLNDFMIYLNCLLLYPHYLHNFLVLHLIRLHPKLWDSRFRQILILHQMNHLTLILLKMKKMLRNIIYQFHLLRLSSILYNFSKT